MVDKKKIIRDAVLDKNYDKPEWFDRIKKEILFALDNPNIDFSKSVNDWVKECEDVMAIEAKYKILLLVEKLNKADEI